jgi:uncharacterized membrane protein YkoI
MKLAHYAPLVLALLPLAPTAQPAPDTRSPQPTRVEDEHEMDPRDVVQHAKISLRDAIARALAAQPGRAVEAELEGEADDGEIDVVYEVVVLTENGELVEVLIDPKSGALRPTVEDEDDDEAEEDDEAEDDDEDEIAGLRTALRHAEFDLATLIEKAESFVKGTPVAAELEFEDGSPLCEVAFVHTRYVIEVEIEGRAGHLIEVELRPETDGAERYEEEDEDDGGEEGEDEEESGEEEEGEEHGEHGHHKGVAFRG